MDRVVRQALFYERLGESGDVRCQLCAQQCLIHPGQRGTCRVRVNEAGTLQPLAYGKLLAMSVDPIEKKPLFHFLPATRSLSIASAGCNLACPWCQNYHLSASVGRTGAIDGDYVEPAAVVAEARARRCESISYTYSEPTIHYEHNRDVGQLARAAGVRNVFVTNGMMSAAAAQDAAETFLDAANVDLKAMNELTYRRHCHGSRDAVLDTITKLHEAGVWLEVTTLVIPGLNDDEQELRDAARFLSALSPELPWHLSRYHPAHRWDAPPTPVETLRRAREIGLGEGLRHVYTGNVWGDEGEHTRCPGCGAALILRHGFRAEVVGLREGRCAGCGASLAGVGLP